MKTLFKSISNFFQKFWKSLGAFGTKRRAVARKTSRSHHHTVSTRGQVVVTSVAKEYKPTTTSRISTGTRKPAGGKLPSLKKTIFSTFFFVFMLAASSATAESIWLNAGEKTRSVYGDHRASHPGDILTIVINETTNNIATKETKANKTSTAQDSIASWFLGSQAAKAKNLNLSGTNNYDGKGNITDQEQVQANIAVMVTDVLPNGNLLIEGVRSVSYSGEKQYIVLQGIVRPEDVSITNTIQSTQVANASINIKDEGDLANAQKKGWLLKLNDFLNPF